MVEKPERHRLDDRRSVDDIREWEVFVRNKSDDALRHVGSIVGRTPDVAHDRASRLFGWYAQDIWLCPATEVCRYSAHDLDAERRPADDASGSEERTTEL